VSGTPKLTAILAADGVGCSRLMGEYEAGTALSHQLQFDGCPKWEAPLYPG
jgi:hypothetical protein